MNPEIHDEYQDLIRQYKTFWLLEDRDYPNGILADHVQYHIERCKECTDLVVQVLWSRCRKSPWKYGPIRTWYAANQVKKQLNTEECNLVNASISRVVVTLIQQAIRDGVTKLRIGRGEIRVEDMEIITKKYRIREEADETQKSLMTMLMEDIAKANESDPWEVGKVVLRVDQVTESGLVNRECIPIYIHPPIILRIKGMAEMKVTVTDRPQTGTIRVRYEERDYDLTVSTIPNDDGEESIVETIEIDICRS